MLANPIRSRHSCAGVPADKCYSSFRCTTCLCGCTRCKRNTHELSRGLSSRANAVERPHIRERQHEPVREFPQPTHGVVKTPLRVHLATCIQGVLRLRGCFAERSSHSSQDDKVGRLLLVLNIHVLSVDHAFVLFLLAVAITGRCAVHRTARSTTRARRRLCRLVHFLG